MGYRPRQPQATALYRVVDGHLDRGQTGTFSYKQRSWQLQIPTGRAQVIEVPDRCD